MTTAENIVFLYECAEQNQSLVLANSESIAVECDRLNQSTTWFFPDGSAVILKGTNCRIL